MPVHVCKPKTSFPAPLTLTSAQTPKWSSTYCNTAAQLPVQLPKVLRGPLRASALLQGGCSHETVPQSMRRRVRAKVRSNLSRQRGAPGFFFFPLKCETACPGREGSEAPLLTPAIASFSCGRLVRMLEAPAAFFFF